MHLANNRWGSAFASLAIVTVWIVAAASPPTATSQETARRPFTFDGAKWIWSSEIELGRLPAGVGYFRADVGIPENPALRSAEVTATCDNAFVLYLNGRPIGESDADNSAWREPKRWDLTGMIAPGRAVLAVEAVNTLPGPAGLILKFEAELADGQRIVLVSNENWKCQQRHVSNWQQPDFDDQGWPKVATKGVYGVGPWGALVVPGKAEPGGQPVGKVAALIRSALKDAAKRGQVGPVVEQEPTGDFAFPAAIAFVGDDCSLYRPHQRPGNAYDSLTVTIFNPRKARTFPEHDLPAPMKIGHKLYVLSPARPGVAPRVLFDAGRGAVGSPSVTFDGRAILVSAAYREDPFFHIWRIPVDGGPPEQLTDGPFHDIDPVELPDGRLAFTSTRIGRFEEYHNPPSRSLYVMNPDGSDLRPLTHTIIFDNEPELLADGRIIFIRSDNFFDRGKVETLLHAIHPDGTTGYTEFGLENGPDYGRRLRAYLCGSPAPMPDGRLAFVSGPGITVGRLGYPAQTLQHFALTAGDVGAMPDGRLLCTTAVRVPVEVGSGKNKKTIQDVSYEKIGVLDPDRQSPTLTVVYHSENGPLHSPVYLGPRQRPPAIPDRVSPRRAGDPQATGVLYCQNARATLQDKAGWSHVRAIRVLAGEGLTTRSSHSYIVHAGSKVTELGTVPLAPDGSFAVEVPADTPIAFQAVDAEGRSELNEMSWIYVRPGERRGCVGCHHKRQHTPFSQAQAPLALESRPVEFVRRPGAHRFRGNNAAVTGLMELQFDRYREVAGLDRHGLHDNPSATGLEEVEALVDVLRGGDPDRRIAAIGRLGVFREPTAAPALCERLSNARNREERLAAAVALAACGTRQSLPVLVRALADQDPTVAQAAAISLENLTGQRQSFDPYGPAETRAAQIAAWRKWIADDADDRLEQELIARLNRGDRDAARRAAVALGHTGTLAAAPALRAYLREHRAENPYPEWKKTHKVDGTQFNATEDVNPRTLQAVARSLGYLGDTGAIPLLAETLDQHNQPDTGNLFLAEACVEALGRIGTPEAEVALVEAYKKLDDYPKYTLWYGDHPALMACHASPVHYFIVEALDRIGSTRAGAILPNIILSLPVDPDRALLMVNDDCETISGRVIRRHRAEPRTVETCLALLGDDQANRDAAIEVALATTHRCWGGHPGPEIRAAQVLSLVCRDRSYAPRILAALERYRRQSVDIPRVFDRGIPVVEELPVKNWVCFYLARALGNLRPTGMAPALVAILEQSPSEAADGHPDPLGPGVLFLHNGLTPCWRAAVAWALGQIADPQAGPVLQAIVADLKNAPDTRFAAAEALGRIADPQQAEALARLAEGYPEESTRRALVIAAAHCRSNQGVAANETSN